MALLVIRLGVARNSVHRVGLLERHARSDHSRGDNLGCWMARWRSAAAGSPAIRHRCRRSRHAAPQAPPDRSAAQSPKARSFSNRWRLGQRKTSGNTFLLCSRNRRSARRPQGPARGRGNIGKSRSLVWSSSIGSRIAPARNRSVSEPGNRERPFGDPGRRRQFRRLR